MNCPFCSTPIHEADHRCYNCGRRLSDTGGPVGIARSSAAFKLDSVIDRYDDEEEPGMEPVPLTGHSPRVFSPGGNAAPGSPLTIQRDTQKVVSISDPENQERFRRPERSTISKSSYLPYQGVLEFVPGGNASRRMLPTAVEAAVYCDYPVATHTHRLLAGAMDLGIIVLCMSLFVGVLALGCEQMRWSNLDNASLASLVLATGAVAFIYEAFWVASGIPSPGMAWAGLRLVHFEGRELSGADAAKRVLGAFVSVLAGGIGLAWALVDEENLTWQDYISRTFPTPVDTQRPLKS